MQEWIEIFPKKYQLFRTELQYMGNTIFIKDRRVCVKLLRSRARGYSEIKAPYDSKRLQTLCQYGKLCKHILSRVAEVTKTHL